MTLPRRKTVRLALSKSDSYREMPFSRDAASRLNIWIEVDRVPDIVEFGKVVRELASNGDIVSIEEAMGLLQRNNIKPNAYIILEMMRAHLNDRRGADDEGALAILLEAVENGLDVNVRLFNLLFSFYGKERRINQLVRLKREMYKAGIAADELTYSALITAFAKSKEVRLGERAYQDMKRDNIRCTEKIYGAMLELYGGSNRVTAAEKVFRSYLKDCEPSTRMYTRMICAYANAGQRMKASRCFEDMKKHGLEPTQVTFNALLRCETRYGSVKSAGNILLAMLKRGEKPDAYTFVALIDAFGRDGDVDKALEVFMLMREAGEVPTTRSFNTVLTACLRNSEVEKASNVFENMQRSGIKPDRVTYNLLISAFGNLGDLDKMWRVYEIMGRSNESPDVHTFTQMIVAFTKARRSAVARQLFQKSLSKTMKKTHPMLFNEYTDALIEAEQFEEALEVFELQKKKGVRQNAKSLRLKRTLYDKLKKLNIEIEGVTVGEAEEDSAEANEALAEEEISHDDGSSTVLSGKEADDGVKDAYVSVGTSDLNADADEDIASMEVLENESDSVTSRVESSSDDEVADDEDIDELIEQLFEEEEEVFAQAQAVQEDDPVASLESEDNVVEARDGFQDRVADGGAHGKGSASQPPK
ncbi:hypothetical protein NDN08_003275 [Rhodosorus marinus]|uniref:Pentacotripeptide-repeat region of PRORP domain-containing protein n=1 Tax=Rhodosorus marinus TaxID=101924 RepID=A0AAV8UXL2_9RHOD|nr:hypothetical protein NDN08_003275 [Rhodosorus marinus]